MLALLLYKSIVNKELQNYTFLPFYVKYVIIKKIQTAQENKEEEK